MKVSFLIDGFNLYHSIRDSIHDGHQCTKWMDLVALCRSSLYKLGRDAQIYTVEHFSAYASHLGDASVVANHKLYNRCLLDSGVIVTLGKFKEKSAKCKYCSRSYPVFEEKRTDVAIATRAIELLVLHVDVVVLVSGDTDLIPVVYTAKRTTPQKKVLFAFPYDRKNKEISDACKGSWKFTINDYIASQFANPYILRDGTAINKPASW